MVQNDVTTIVLFFEKHLAGLNFPWNWLHSLISSILFISSWPRGSSTKILVLAYTQGRPNDGLLGVTGLDESQRKSFLSSPKKDDAYGSHMTGATP